MKRISTDDLPYDVASVDVVAELPELRVSVLTLSPGQEVPWHYHPRVTDSFFCLSGSVSIEHGVGGRAELEPGESYQVPARTPHRVRGAEGVACRFLIVQGIGAYDFVPTERPAVVVSKARS